MSTNGNFEMPTVVGMRSPYAPRVDIDQQHQEDHHGAPTLDLRASIPHGAEAIKSWLRFLTHREMREFVAEIFVAHAKLHPQSDTVLARAITAVQLADVLDTVAHGD